MPIKLTLVCVLIAQLSYAQENMVTFLKILNQKQSAPRGVQRIEEFTYSAINMTEKAQSDTTIDLQGKSIELYLTARTEEEFLSDTQSNLKSFDENNNLVSTAIRNYNSDGTMISEEILYEDENVASLMNSKKAFD